MSFTLRGLGVSLEFRLQAELQTLRKIETITVNHTFYGLLTRAS